MFYYTQHHDGTTGTVLHVSRRCPGLIHRSRVRAIAPGEYAPKDVRRTCSRCHAGQALEDRRVPRAQPLLDETD